MADTRDKKLESMSVPKKEDHLKRTGWMPVIRWVKWDHPDVVMRAKVMTTDEAMAENERLGIAKDA